MKWYDKAVFYHIYPLGLCGCKKENNGEKEQHFDKLTQWSDHAAELGFTAIYIGPLFESEGHGYETRDYKQVDCRLGTNDDFKKYVAHCHEKGMHIIVDGVFNHVGRTFPAFQDLLKNRENSAYKDWFCNVNFGGNNEYNDGLSYENWGGYNLLVKLNQRNPEVKSYLFEAIKFWIDEFDIDGIRLDAADVLDFDFMRELRGFTSGLKEDFWLMGEVIHGDYSRWANGDMLDSVTNYELHKGLYSGHNDHNYFEIAHSVKRLLGICGDTRLYTFVDNHDVERIASQLEDKEHLPLIYAMEFAMPGVPGVYYGSEWGMEGKKEQGSDDSLRPRIHKEDLVENELTDYIAKLAKVREGSPALKYGDYLQLAIAPDVLVFQRRTNEDRIIFAMNCGDNEFTAHFDAQAGCGTDLITGESVDFGGGLVIKGKTAMIIRTEEVSLP